MKPKLHKTRARRHTWTHLILYYHKQTHYRPFFFFNELTSRIVGATRIYPLLDKQSQTSLLEQSGVVSLQVLQEHIALGKFPQGSWASCISTALLPAGIPEGRQEAEGLRNSSFQACCPQFSGIKVYIICKEINTRVVLMTVEYRRHVFARDCKIHDF